MALSPLVRKDVKWIFAILSVISLLPAILFSGIYQATKERPAVAITSGLLIRALDTVLSQQRATDDLIPNIGKDDDRKLVAEKDKIVEQIKELAAKSPNKKLEIPDFPLGIPITLTGKDILQTPDDKVITEIADNLAKNLYTNSATTMEDAGGKGDMGDQIPLYGDLTQKGVGLLSSNTHSFAGAVQAYLAIPGLILLLAATRFSTGSGRAITPGLVLAFSALPSVILYGTASALLIGTSAVSGAIADTTGKSGGMTPLMDGLMLAANGASRQALIIFAIGNIAVIGGFIWGAISRGRRKEQSRNHAPNGPGQQIPTQASATQSSD